MKPSMLYVFGKIRIYWFNFRGLNSLSLKSEAEIFSLVWFSPRPDNPDILILFDAEARNITCRRHVSLLQMFRNVIQFINSVETTSNFDWTFFILKVIKKGYLHTLNKPSKEHSIWSNKINTIFSHNLLLRKRKNN